MGTTVEELKFKMSGDSAEARAEALALQKSLTDLFTNPQAQIEKTNASLDLMAKGMSAAGQQATASAKMVAGMSKSGMEALAKSTKDATVEGTSWTSWVGKANGLLGTFGIALGAAAVVSFGKELLADADLLMKLHDKTDISVESLQRMRYAGDDAGVSLDAMAAAVNKMQKNLAGGDDGAEAAIERLGLHLKDLRSLSPEDQFYAIAERIKEIKDPADQVNAAVAIFGKSGAELLPVIKRGFDDVKDASIGMSREAVEGLDRTGDAITHLWQAAKSYSGEVLGKLLSHPKGEAESLRDSLKRAADEAEKGRPKFGAVIPPSLPKDLAAIDSAFKSQEKSINAAADAAEAHEKALKAVNQKIADATRDIGHLTTAQQESIVKYTALGLSNDDIALKLGISSLAIKRFKDDTKLAEEALDDLIEDMARTRAEAEKLAPKLGGVGFVQAHQDVTLLVSSTKQLHGGMTVMGDTLDHVLIPAFSETIGVVAGSTAAIREAKDESDRLNHSLRDGLKSTLAGLPALLQQAFTGGGGISGALKALGVQLSEAVLKPILAGMSAVKQAAVAGAASAATVGVGALRAGASWQQALGGVAMTTATAMASAAIAAGGLTASTVAVGAATMGIGAAAIGVYMLAKHWLSVSQAEKDARTEFETYQKNFGSLDDMIAKVGQAYADTGRTGEMAQHDLNVALDATHHSAAEVHAALMKINDVMIEQQQLAAALKVVDDRLQGLLTTVDTVGIGLPDAFRPMVERMLELPGLTDNAKTALQGLLDDAKPNYAKLEALAKGYGGEIGKLGPAFQQAHVTADAARWINDFETLKDAGGDVNGMLDFMADEASAVVQESIKFNTTIPENMRGMLEALAANGQLLDENKQQITDISTLKFGAAVKTDVDKLKDAITLLADAIDKIPGKLNQIAHTSIPPIHVPVIIDHPDVGSDIVDAGGGAATEPIPSFANRTMERVVGAGLALLHPGDVVGVPRAGQFAAAGGGEIHIHFNGHTFLKDRRAIDELAVKIGDSIASRVRSTTQVGLGRGR